FAGAGGYHQPRLSCATRCCPRGDGGCTDGQHDRGCRSQPARSPASTCQGSKMTTIAFPDKTARRYRLNWRRWRLLLIGGFLVALVLIAAVFANLVAPYSPYDLDVSSMLQGPSAAHWLGTDEVGRDVLSRAIYAARISVEVALVAVG